MTHEEALVKVRGYLTDLIPSEDYDEVEEIMLALEQEPKTWNLNDARDDFICDVYNTLDFLPTNNEANQIIDIFDRVTGGIRKEPKWIPVNEKLPEERDWYLVVFKESDTGFQLIPRVADYIGRGENKWQLMNEDCLPSEYRDLLECIAWMSLPEPYKVESEN